MAKDARARTRATLSDNIWKQRGEKKVRVKKKKKTRRRANHLLQLPDWPGAETARRWVGGWMDGEGHLEMGLPPSLPPSNYTARDAPGCVFVFFLLRCLKVQKQHQKKSICALSIYFFNTDRLEMCRCAPSSSPPMITCNI